MLDDTDDRPNVVIHPPTLFFGSLLVGYALRASLGTLSPLPEVLAEGLGLILCLVSMWLAMATITTFADGGERLKPDTPSHTLFRTGVFRFSRNPIYLSMMTFSIGFGLATQNLWMFFSAAILGVILNFLVIVPEEKYLAERFGAEYESYRNAVRRWL